MLKLQVTYRVQLRFLLRLKCRTLQHYFCAKPTSTESVLPLEEVNKIINRKDTQIHKLTKQLDELEKVPCFM